ncbi:MAG: nucleoside deaminase [Planctomycetota bacterium]
MPPTPPASDAALLARAVALATENARSGRGGPFGAVVARDGVVIAEGTNLVTATHDPTAHAEIVAIRAASRALRSHQLDRCVVYASCEPCPMCLGALYWARPAAVWFAASREDAAAAGFDDALVYAEVAAPPDARRIPFRRALEVEGRAPFDAWRANGARRAY